MRTGPTVLLAVALLLAGAGPLCAQADASDPGHTPTRYDITLVPSDTGAHVLLEVETAWRLGSSLSVIVRLDSVFRVIRVLVDGKPNTRISRTEFARSPEDVLVPHEKHAGDTLTSRLRYHGIPRGGVRAGPNRYGDRTLVAQAATAEPSRWIPVPEPRFREAVVSLRLQTDSGGRAIADGKLASIDTLAYGHMAWTYITEHPIPFSEIAGAAGPYAVTTLARGGCVNPCTPVAVWTWSRDSSFASGGPFRRAASMMDYFTRLLGPFPFTSLSHVEAAIPRPTVRGASVVLYDESRCGDRGIDERLVARETARQWLIPGAPDSAADYLAGLWIRDPTASRIDPKDTDRIRGFLRHS